MDKLPLSARETEPPDPRRRPQLHATWLHEACFPGALCRAAPQKADFLALCYSEHPLGGARRTEGSNQGLGHSTGQCFPNRAALVRGLETLVITAGQVGRREAAHRPTLQSPAPFRGCLAQTASGTDFPEATTTQEGLLRRLKGERPEGSRGTMEWWALSQLCLRCEPIVTIFLITSP